MAIEKDTFMNVVGALLLIGALVTVGVLLSGSGSGDRTQRGGISITPQGTTVVITAEQVQAKLAPKFPLTRKGPLGLSVELSDPVVVLKRDDDRIRLTCNARLRYPALTIGSLELVASGDLIGGQATVSGKLDYDAEAGALFFTQPKLDALHVDGLHEKLLEPARKLCTKLLKKHLAKIELHRLGETWQERAAKMFVKQVMIKGGVIRIDLGLPEGEK